MKLSFEEKVEIYNEWKLGMKSVKRIAKERSLSPTNIYYFVSLADRYGICSLKHKWTYYSKEFKEKAIQRALLAEESALAISLDLGLANHGMLSRWMREYVENKYNVIERKKGRNGKEENTRRDEKRDSRAPSRKQGITPKESKADYRERIYKKIDALVSEREKLELRK